MTELVIPTDAPRVPPLPRQAASPTVRSEYDKTINTWGIPNNLIATLAWHPGLALTEVDYANSFIFDEGAYAPWPRPGGNNPAETTLYPVNGFIDRVTKELVINLVSLLNRSRYSITHHTVIAYSTLSTILPDKQPKARAKRAEEMLFNLVDDDAQPAFEKARSFARKPLYSEVQLRAMRLAVKLQGDPHDVTDEEFDALRMSLVAEAKTKIKSGLLNAEVKGNRSAYVDMYVNSMLIELTWCILHFAGLLNKWFVVLKVMDESDTKRDGIDFVSHYNNLVPKRIKIRNNKILGPNGWG